jgi:3-hydroxy-9,10-secoandrosta-1,3,5(10)-triene-9,17-dione monooxygenase reductase component
VDTVSDPHRIPHGEIPEGIRPDARDTWPSHDLIESWLGDAMYDFQLRPGEDVVVDGDDPEAVEAARRFRDVMGRFASGVTVVTSISGGAPVGLTCQSFSSVSLNPPLVMFIPAKTSRAWPAIQRSGKFCVNFLTADQAELSNQMASKGVDKFAGVSWSPAPATGAPLIHDTLAYVDCQIHQVHEAGDHHIVVGRVLDLGLPDEGSDIEWPLLFYRGQYATTAPRTPGQNA